MTDPLLFFVAALALLTAPGPTNTLLATSGAQVGVRASLPSVAAELAGYLIAVSAYRLVLGPVMAAYPVAGVVLKVAAALFVVWLAIRLWHSDSRLGSRRITAPSVFVATLLNPKALIAALTILPAASDHIAWYIAGFGAVVLCAGSGWVLLGRFIASSAGESRVKYVPRVASVVLVGFAGLIAASALN